MRQLNALETVFQAAGQLLAALLELAVALFAIAVDHWVLIAWVSFFLFLIRWPDLRAQFTKGAVAAAVLLYILAAFVWGVCTKPTLLTFETQVDPMGVSIIEKFGMLAFWIGVAFVCGALQDYWRVTPEEIEIAGPPEAAEGAHDAHGGHGHGGGHGAHH